jgi:outer membrane protein OmpA-like peptidoglycan-associated protein
MVRLALGDDECAGYGYEQNEVTLSHKEKGHLEFDVLDGEDGEVLIVDFGVDWRHVKQHTLNNKRLTAWLKVFEEDTGFSLEIFGYSDCTGNERNNFLLRRGRASAVYRLLGRSARNRVKFYGEAPTGTYVMMYPKNRTVK